jgi:hypothetical protein
MFRRTFLGRIVEQYKQRIKNPYYQYFEMPFGTGRIAGKINYKYDPYEGKWIF